MDGNNETNYKYKCWNTIDNLKGARVGAVQPSTLFSFGQFSSLASAHRTGNDSEYTRCQRYPATNCTTRTMFIAPASAVIRSADCYCLSISRLLWFPPNTDHHWHRIATFTCILYHISLRLRRHSGITSYQKKFSLGDII